MVQEGDTPNLKGKRQELTPLTLTRMAQPQLS